MELAGRILGPGHSALVIAEIGNNHDGSVHQAERLVDAAAEAGADAAKFQTHIAEAEMHPSTPTPPHFPEPRWEFTKRMQLSLDEHRHLKAYTEEKGLIFFSSPFSVEAVDLLEEVEVPLYKIASGEVTNPPDRGDRGHREAGAPLERHVGDPGAGGRDGDPRAGRQRRARHAVHLELPVPAREGQPARDAGSRRALREALRSLRPHARHPHVDRRDRARSVGDREALHALEATLRPRSSRLADSGGAGTSRRRRPPGRGSPRERRRSAIPSWTRRARRSRRASSPQPRLRRGRRSSARC